MSIVCNVKKSVSVPECFVDPNNSKTLKSAADNIYYEEAWDLRMARLGIDISKLNDEFNDTCEVKDCTNEMPSTMTRSCIEPPKSNESAAIIRMTSSAIENSVIANNPVYSFKPYAYQSTNSPSKSNNTAKYMSSINNNYATTQRLMMTNNLEDDEDLQHCTATLRPTNTHRGLLLNNSCYEISSSQLINAILDRDRDPIKNRLPSSSNVNKPSSAFRSLAPGSSKFLRQTLQQQQQDQLRNNQCYNNTLPGPMSLNFHKMPHSGYSRQISAPTADTGPVSDIQMKRLYPEPDSQTKSLHYKSVKRSTKQHYDTAIRPWPPDQYLPEQQPYRFNNKTNNLMTQSMITDESKLSDNYIKHLKGQEIAGNFIKQSHRPECHIQRTEDRYHMGFHDSRLDMIADSNRPLEEHLWYHPHLSRVGAEQLLGKYPEGSFLVRRSESSTNEYSLSIRYKQKWLHMKITRDQDGQFVLGQYSQPYPSIPIMIRHYSCSFLPVKGANLISLTQPVFRH